MNVKVRRFIPVRRGRGETLNVPAKNQTPLRFIARKVYVFRDARRSSRIRLTNNTAICTRTEPVNNFLFVRICSLVVLLAVGNCSNRLLPGFAIETIRTLNQVNKNNFQQPCLHTELSLRDGFLRFWRMDKVDVDRWDDFFDTRSGQILDISFQIYTAEMFRRFAWDWINIGRKTRGNIYIGRLDREGKQIL